jgi:hypothetical protein
VASDLEAAARGPSPGPLVTSHHGGRGACHCCQVLRPPAPAPGSSLCGGHFPGRLLRVAFTGSLSALSFPDRAAYSTRSGLRVFSYEPRTARKSCSCSLERAGIFTTARVCHGMLVPSRQRDEWHINTSCGLLPMRAILRRASRCRRPKRRFVGAKKPPSA